MVGELRHNRRDFELIGEAADGDAALALIVAEQPDVALLDLRMPGLDGLEICERVTALGLRTRVVLLSAFTDAELVWLAESAGAAGYLDKGSPRGEVRAALRRVADGERVFSRPALAALNGGAPALD
jgi:two-component system, NarL family, nitrate/nitrite response regulator NarL